MLRTACFAALGLLCAAPVHAATLTVHVEGVRSGQGQVGCALFSRAAGFPGTDRNAVTQVRQARPGDTACVFTDVKPGTYAVSVVHDVNGNGRLDSNLLGIPREDWGVSNNARPALRAPRFAEAAFTVASRPKTIRVRIAPFSLR